MMRFKIAFLLPVLILAVAGCGGAGGGTQLTVDTSQAPLDFSLRHGGQPLNFSVEMSSEAEFRGTGVTSSIRYQWRADDWRVEEDGSQTARVTFSKVKAAMRRGSSISMEPITEFDRLEGFSLRFQHDKEGFKPVSEPAKDKTFMAIFDQLQRGLSALDIEMPEEAIYPGSDWQEIVDKEGMGLFGSAVLDSVAHLHYAGNEEYQGRSCARIDYEAELNIDGIVSVDEGNAMFKGKIETKGHCLFDRARGFILKDGARIRINLDQREVDEDGKPQGPEQSITQTLNFTVTYIDG